MDLEINYLYKMRWIDEAKMFGVAEEKDKASFRHIQCGDLPNSNMTRMNPGAVENIPQGLGAVNKSITMKISGKISP